MKHVLILFLTGGFLLLGLEKKDCCCPIQDGYIRDYGIIPFRPPLAVNKRVTIRAGESNQNVQSIVNGEVVKIDSIFQYVKIKTNRGFLSYHFVDKIQVFQGDSISFGSIIGVADSTLGAISIYFDNDSVIDIEHLIKCCGKQE